jgi:plastocyanin
MRGILIGFGLVLLCVGLIALIGSQPEDTPPSGGDRVQRGPVQGELRAAGRRFQPERVTAIANTTLTLRNTDDEEHGVRFENGDLRDIDRVAPRGAETLDVGRQGEYRFVCPIHPEMRGTLVVEPAES